MPARRNTAADAFVHPGSGAGLLDVVRHRYLLSLLVRKEVQVRYRGSVLGWAWSYVKPATQFLVFYIGLGVFLGLNDSQPNYAVYLFSGIVLINLFNEAFANATRSLIDNGALIKKIFLPRELFPVASTIIALVNFLPQAVVLLLACILLGWTPAPLQLLGIFAAVLLITTLAVGLGMLFGAANVSFRDSQNFVDLIVMVATWVSPVLYPFAQVERQLPDWAVVVYQLNPITAAVNLSHAGFWYPTTDGRGALPSDIWLFAAAGFGLSLVILILGQLLFRRLEGRFAQDL